MIAAPPAGKPKSFYRFFAIWAALFGFALAWPLLPKSDLPNSFRPMFWLTAFVTPLILASAARGFAHWLRYPLTFDPGDGTPPRRLRSTRLALWLLMTFLIGLTGTVFTIGSLPFSPAARLLAGLRGRKIELPRGEVQTADLMLAEIYLQPIAPLTRETAAALAAQLRAETGLHIAALREQKFDLSLNPQRNQIPVEKVATQLNQLGQKTPLPPPPLPHSPLMIALIEPDMYSENLPWKYAFSMGFGKTLGVVSAARVKNNLPMDDAAAQRLCFTRMKKLILRLIAQMVFSEPYGSDRRSLTGPVLRNLADLDLCEDHLPFSPQDRIKAMPR
jgi:hypothetical protein